MKKPPQNLVGMIEKLNALRPSDYNAPDIKIVIAVLDEKDGKPRNWSLNSYGEEPKTSTGGCWCRLWAWQSTEKIDVMFSGYGPEIGYGSVRDYEHGARAEKLILSRLKAMSDQRGNTLDAAEYLGRWLEACGVEKVYVRPEGENASWHNEGDWDCWLVGRAIQEVRARFPKVEAAEVAA